MLNFITKEHRLRLCHLLARAQVNVSDTVPLAFFYIIAASPLLYARVNNIYDFVFHTADISSLYSGVIPPETQDWSLLCLAFALIDTSIPADVDQLFSAFENESLDTALEALRVRYQTPYPFE